MLSLRGTQESNFKRQGTREKYNFLFYKSYYILRKIILFVRDKIIIYFYSRQKIERKEDGGLSLKVSINVSHQLLIMNLRRFIKFTPIYIRCSPTLSSTCHGLIGPFFMILCVLSPIPFVHGIGCVIVHPDMSDRNDPNMSY